MSHPQSQTSLESNISKQQVMGSSQTSESKTDVDLNLTVGSGPHCDDASPALSVKTPKPLPWGVKVSGKPPGVVISSSLEKEGLKFA